MLVNEHPVLHCIRGDTHLTVSIQRLLEENAVVSASRVIKWNSEIQIQ